ncbi:hypothetical protein Rhopal_004751-T1 [Rhodotorula paludigena]|uniref:Uncharacterized protein n=1 Tax=Rhodotorula paludigena TaxID=86838 RepID=A0AAV5GNG4_9BASI|nr:hypothetical protein Rhopal_004751-T1 [Rhodotorula paludigena]
MSLGSREALGPGSPPSLNVGHLFPTIVLADGRLRIPTELPPDPLCRPVRLEDLELDDELAESGATLEYTLASLRRMVVTLELPHRPAWPLLHRYLYDGSPAQLLNNLLTTPTPLPPPTSSATPGGQALSAAQQRDLDSLLIRLMRVREVWLDAAALELSDVALWATLRRAWDVLVADLGELAADIPGSKIPGRNEEAV